MEKRFWATGRQMEEVSVAGSISWWNAAWKTFIPGSLKTLSLKGDYKNSKGSI